MPTKRQQHANIPKGGKQTRLQIFRKDKHVADLKCSDNHHKLGKEEMHRERIKKQEGREETEPRHAAPVAFIATTTIKPNKQASKQTNKQASKQASTHASKQISKQASKSASKSAIKQISKQASKQASKQRNEQTNKQNQTNTGTIEETTAKS